jgi:hypothetical protein
MSENNEIQLEAAQVKKTKPKASVSEEAKEVLDEGIISSPEAGKKVAKKVPALKPVDSGAIGSSSAYVFEKDEKVIATKTVEKVAIFSTKNVSWAGVGSVSKGYNFVTKAHAEKWLTRSHTREATPQEVANNLKG